MICAVILFKSRGANLDKIEIRYHKAGPVLFCSGPALFMWFRLQNFFKDKSQIFLLAADKFKAERYNNDRSQTALSFCRLRKGGPMNQAAKCMHRDTPESRTYTVEDIASILNIGRTSAYNLVKEGHFKTVRIGNAIRISKKSFDEWLDTLAV